MKSKVILFALLAFGLIAQAGNEGPQAVPKAPIGVLAEYVANGGFFVPPGKPSSYRYQILTDGSAQVVVAYRSSPKLDVKFLKNFSSAEMEHIFALVKSIVPGELFDANPENPGCMDAPSFSYYVYQAQTSIEIASKFACKEMSRKNATAADDEVIQILKDLENLARQ